MSRKKGDRTIKEPVIKGILKDRKRRMTYGELARKYGISTSSVAVILKENGMTHPLIRQRGESARLYKAIAADYVKGVPRDDICEAHGINYSTIYAALDWCGERLGYKIPRRRVLES